MSRRLPQSPLFRFHLPSISNGVYAFKKHEGAKRFVPVSCPSGINRSQHSSARFTFRPALNFRRPPYRNCKHAVEISARAHKSDFLFIRHRQRDRAIFRQTERPRLHARILIRAFCLRKTNPSLSLSFDEFVYVARRLASSGVPRRDASLLGVIRIYECRSLSM